MYVMQSTVLNGQGQLSPVSENLMWSVAIEEAIPIHMYSTVQYSTV